MKKNIFIGLSMLSLLFVSGCNLNSSNEDKVIQVKGTKDENVKTLARHTILGLAGVNQSSNLTAKKMANNLTDQEVIDIKEALAQVEVLLNEDNVLTVNEVTSDKQDYQNKIELSFIDNDISMYYNDVFEDIETDEDETEKTVSFKGIALYNEIEYDFTFVSEEEVELSENEKESTLTLFKDAANYIKIEQGFEEEVLENEVSYGYSEVVNDVEVIDFELSIKTELLEKKVELELNEVEYEIKYINKDNKELILVELEREDDSKVKALFEKVVITNEDGSSSNTYKLLD